MNFRLYTIVFLTLAILGCKESFKNDKRIIKDSFLQLESTFEFEDGYILRCWADDSLIYLSTAPEYYIYIYSHSGKFIKKLGTPGEAPWQNGAIGSFAVDKDKVHYWIQDMHKLLLKKYSLDTDSMISYTKLNNRSNPQYIGDNKFLKFCYDDKDIKFITYDGVSNEILSEHSLIESSKGEIKRVHPFSDYVFTSFSCRNSDEIIAFDFMYLGRFVIYDSKKDSMYYYKDFRNLDFPEVTIENNLVKLNPYHDLYGSCAIDKNYVYLLTTKYLVKNNWDEGKEYFADAYSIKDGKYSFSFKVQLNNDDSPYFLCKVKNRIITCSKNGSIAVYKTQE